MSYTWEMRMSLLLFLLLALPLMAQTVYKTNEDGVTSFSDTPPAEGEAEVFTIATPAPVDDGLLDQRLAAMRETTDRMAADRREREQHRAELRALQTPAPEPPAQPQSIVTTPVWSQSYWSGYQRPLRPPPPIYPWRPTPQPLPHQPALPSAPPGWSVMQPGNAQLMRPIVSSRN
jgi:hypothetical protein